MTEPRTIAFIDYYGRNAGAPGRLSLERTDIDPQSYRLTWTHQGRTIIRGAPTPFELLDFADAIIAELRPPKARPAVATATVKIEPEFDTAAFKAKIADAVRDAVHVVVSR